MGSRACAAYRAGDAGEAARAAREARGLRAGAVEEHAGAAQRILAENNEQRGLGRWALDLHGLHGNEAIAAVEDRWGPRTSYFSFFPMSIFPLNVPLICRRGPLSSAQLVFPYFPIIQLPIESAPHVPSGTGEARALHCTLNVPLM